MKSQIEKINEVAHKLASAMYAKTQAEGGAEGESGAEGEGEPQGSGQSEGENTPSDDDVVDAEFEDISKK